MQLTALPAQASWRHRGLQCGYEVMFPTTLPSGIQLRGSTTAVESGSAWSVAYRIEADRRWQTRRVDASNSTMRGERRVSIHRAADGHWEVDGHPRADLDGCVDVDFESSSATNTLPVHRIRFAPGEPVQVPAAFVRAEDLRIERMEQEYTLTSADDAPLAFHYESSTFGVACELTFDTSGLLLLYPGLALRDR
ncbi:putative glycolipid-binding domain-containing protein [Cryobacterium sp. AP23]